MRLIGYFNILGVNNSTANIGSRMGKDWVGVMVCMIPVFVLLVLPFPLCRRYSIYLMCFCVTHCIAEFMLCVMALVIFMLMVLG